MEDKDIKKIKYFQRFLTIVSLMVAILSATVLPVMAWFSRGNTVAFYGPVSSPEAIAIGAGHKELSENNVDDARFLYFDELDVTNGDYMDFLFCVYGQAVGYFKLQLAFTTNNQFTYDIFHAHEIAPGDGDYHGMGNYAYFDNYYNPDSPNYDPELNDAILYVTHTDTPQRYYYVVDPEVNGGNQITGTFFNKTTETVDDIQFVVADGTKHSATYGAYNSVNNFAEPIYWQTASSIQGDQNNFFVKYFILRVGLNGKETNDRETDILCIATKTSTAD